MPDMPDQPGMSHHEEGAQEPALGALDIRQQIKQIMEEMLEGLAKEFMQHEHKVLQSTALAFLESNKQDESIGHDMLSLPLLKHETILWRQRMRPMLDRNEEGDYEGVALKIEEAQALVEDHPKWRRKNFRTWSVQEFLLADSYCVLSAFSGSHVQCPTMATAAVGFKSREDHRKQLELEEARKAGLAPAELDEDGKEINPHIPQYMSSAPWYLNAERPSLKHQRKWKSDPNYSKDWYDRGAKVYQAEKYRKGACIK
ncbi:hypothetical protein L7F22_038470 [Adiantum nelumboides]|nr:hypothetical protein [Adiantum nelumboides]